MCFEMGHSAGCLCDGIEEYYNPKYDKKINKGGIKMEHYLPNFKEKVLVALSEDIEDIKNSKLELAERYGQLLEDDLREGIRVRELLRREEKISKLRFLLGTMSNYEKLEIVKKLMQEISDNWNEDDVIKYGCETSFDQLTLEINSINLKIDIK